MRIWDVEPKVLCRVHLLGEHRELHAIWIILTKNKKGYRNHPETKRWVGRLRALYIRHENLVIEMRKRNYNHNSNLDNKLATGESKQKIFIHSLKEQEILLKNKNCSCLV